MYERPLKTLLTAVIGLCAIPMMAGLALALDPVIYDNGVVSNTGLSSQLDTAYPFESQVADDFSVSGLDYSVTGISFTGVEFGTPPSLPNPLDFNILFYADDGSGTSPLYTGDGTSSPAADSIVIATGSVTAPEAAPGPYSYTLEFPAIPLSANTTYWVAVQSVNIFPPQFGWEGDNTGGNSVSGFPLLGTAFWAAANTEMNFQLHGVQVPEPATGLMLLIGLVGLGFCRRR